MAARIKSSCRYFLFDTRFGSHGAARSERGLTELHGDGGAEIGVQLRVALSRVDE